MYSQLVLPKTVNIKPHIEDLAYDFVERLKGKKEVEGVVLLGGLGVRNFLDKHSDVDIAVFVDYKECELKILPTWLPRFDFHVKLPKPVDDIEDIEFNVHQQILSAEREHEWDEGKKAMPTVIGKRSTGKDGCWAWRLFSSGYKYSTKLLDTAFLSVVLPLKNALQPLSESIASEIMPLVMILSFICFPTVSIHCR